MSFHYFWVNCWDCSANKRKRQKEQKQNQFKSSRFQRERAVSTCGSSVDPHFSFHIYQRCVKPPAANCFHITERQGDLGGSPRPPTRRDTGGGAHSQKAKRCLCCASAGERRPHTEPHTSVVTWPSTDWRAFGLKPRTALRTALNECDFLSAFNEPPLHSLGTPHLCQLHLWAGQSAASRAFGRRVLDARLRG